MNTHKSIYTITLEFDVEKDAIEFFKDNQENISSEWVSFDVFTEKYWIIVTNKQAAILGIS